MEKYTTVFEDDNILIIDKSFGLEVTGAGGLEEDLQKGNSSVKACNRIDVQTQGLVIFSKNEESYNLILDAFEKSRVKKIYLAWVYGRPKERKSSMTAHLFKDAKNAKVTVYNKKIPGSREIVTNFSLVKNFKNGSSILSVEIPTGRTHQIRAHLAYLGLPIIGDDKYGKREVNRAFNKKFQCLTSAKVEFNFEKGSRLEYLNNQVFETAAYWMKYVDEQ